MVTPRKILLTGRPGCGKTTLIKCVVNSLAGRTGGFYTEEMREHGVRVGFKLAEDDRVRNHVHLIHPHRSFVRHPVLYEPETVSEAGVLTAFFIRASMSLLWRASAALRSASSRWVV